MMAIASTTYLITVRPKARSAVVASLRPMQMVFVTITTAIAGIVFDEAGPGWAHTVVCIPWLVDFLKLYGHTRSNASSLLVLSWLLVLARVIAANLHVSSHSTLFVILMGCINKEPQPSYEEEAE